MPKYLEIVISILNEYRMNIISKNEKKTVEVDNDQEMGQSERNSHSKNRGEKNYLFVSWHNAQTINKNIFQLLKHI